MKKSSGKRFLNAVKAALLMMLALSLVILAFAGCGKKDEPADSGKETGTTAAPVTEGTEAKTEAQTEPAEAAKIPAGEVGETIKFGKFEQDNNEENGAEEIEWIILAVEDGRELIISKDALDLGENSTMRAWLNGEFLDSFSEGDLAVIAESDVKAYANPSYESDPGKNVTDKVFLLSITEIGEYFESASELLCGGTDYAIARGLFVTSGGGCWWWLRTPGGEAGFVSGVDGNGAVSEAGNTAHLIKHGVRPAMWINVG